MQEDLSYSRHDGADYMPSLSHLSSSVTYILLQASTSIAMQRQKSSVLDHSLKFNCLFSVTTQINLRIFLMLHLQLMTKECLKISPEMQSCTIVVPICGSLILEVCPTCMDYCHSKFKVESVVIIILFWLIVPRNLE